MSAYVRSCVVWLTWKYDVFHEHVATHARHVHEAAMRWVALWGCDSLKPTMLERVSCAQAFLELLDARGNTIAKLDERYIERRHGLVKQFWHGGQRGGGFKGHLQNTADTLKRVFVATAMHGRAMMLGALSARSGENRKTALSDALEALRVQDEGGEGDHAQGSGDEGDSADDEDDNFDLDLSLLGLVSDDEDDDEDEE